MSNRPQFHQAALRLACSLRRRSSLQQRRALNRRAAHWIQMAAGRVLFASLAAAAACFMAAALSSSACLAAALASSLAAAAARCLCFLSSFLCSFCRVLLPSSSCSATAWSSKSANTFAFANAMFVVFALVDGITAGTLGTTPGTRGPGVVWGDVKKDGTRRAVKLGRLPKPRYREPNGIFVWGPVRHVRGLGLGSRRRRGPRAKRLLVPGAGDGGASAR